MVDITRTIDELHRTLDTLAIDESIPAGPDRARIIEWSIRVHLDWWKTSPADPTS
jgi:hypothetical protein